MYLGIVEKVKNKKLNEEQINDYLKRKGVIDKIETVAGTTLTFNRTQKKQSFFERIKNGLFYKKNIKLDKPKYQSFEKSAFINVNDFKASKCYSTNFKEELYYYITRTFKGLINMRFYQISTRNNNEIEVVSNEILINELTRSIFIRVFREAVNDYSELSKIDGDIDSLPERRNYFRSLKKQKDNFINDMDNYPELIDNYLLGNEVFIKERLLSTCKIIEDIIEFEYKFKYLKAFNKKYFIEETSKETVDDKYSEIYSGFSELFSSVEVVEFTFSKISRFEKLHSANISSLYYALFERNLVSKNKTEFLRYVSKEHGIEFGKIREDKTKGLTPHKTRVNQFLEEIDACFPSQKQ